MENATRALLIAGTVLIAIIIVSIAVTLYLLYSDQADQYSQTISAVEVAKFNSKFNVYVGRENITPQEVVAVVNLANEYGDKIQIYLGSSRLQFLTISQEDFIKLYQDKLFSCKSNSFGLYENPVYDVDGKIIKLIFKEV